MSITVKRSCNSNIHQSDEKINFNAFTIVLDGEEYAKFKKLLELPGEPYPAAVLHWIISRGLDAQMAVSYPEGEE